MAIRTFPNASYGPCPATNLVAQSICVDRDMDTVLILGKERSPYSQAIISRTETESMALLII